LYVKNAGWTKKGFKTIQAGQPKQEKRKLIQWGGAKRSCKTHGEESAYRLFKVSILQKRERSSAKDKKKTTGFKQKHLQDDYHTGQTQCWKPKQDVKGNEQKKGAGVISLEKRSYEREKGAQEDESFKERKKETKRAKG